MAQIDKALTTLARQKSFMEITKTNKDTLLTMLIIAVSKEVERYCRRTFGREAVSNELYDGKGTDKLVLKKQPVDTGQTFTLQKRDTSQNTSSWQTIDSEDYYVKPTAGIIQLYGEFVPGIHNYRVSYTAGYHLPYDTANYQNETDDDKDLPYEIEMAVWEIVQEAYNRRKSRGVKSEKVGDISVTFASVISAQKELKRNLDSYRVLRYG